MPNDTISPAGGITLSGQIDDVLRKKIISGEWKPDERIPSENSLAAEFDVSRSTVRTVVLQLVGEGLLYRVQGKGTFVSEPHTAMPFKTLGIRDKLDKLLPTHYSVTARAEYAAPPEQVAKLFGMIAGEEMFCLERVRFRTASSTLATIYQYNWIRRDLGKHIDLSVLTTGRLTHELRDKCGLTPYSMHEWLEAGGANATEAAALKLSVGAPVLIMDELSFDRDNRPYTFNRFTFPANQLRLSFTDDSIVK